MLIIMENQLETSSLVLQKGPADEVQTLRALEPVAAFAGNARGIPAKMNAFPDPERYTRMTNLAPWARLYAEAFAGEPWNEVGRCGECGTFYPELGGNCINDGSLVGEAYPLAETIQYIKNEWTKPNCFVVLTRLTNEKAISFAWGYQITVEEFLAEKNAQDVVATEVFKNVITTALRISETDPVFYISETGTSPSYRGNGLASLSLRKMIAFAQSKDIPVILRTNVGRPSMYGIAQTLGMKQLTGPIRDTNEYVNVEDTVNPNRVIFIL
jgi:hypothetical protein